MSISKMKRLELVLMRADVKRVMRKLIWLSSIQLEEANELSDSEKQHVFEFEAEEARNELAILEKAANNLVTYGNIKSGLFTPPPSIALSDFENGQIGKNKYSEIINIATDINEKSSRLDEFAGERAHLISILNSLDPFMSYDLPLSETSTETAAIIIGAIPASMNDETATNALSGLQGLFIKELSKDAEHRYIFIVCFKKEKETAIRSLSSLGFTRREFSDLTGPPIEEAYMLKKQLERIDSETEYLKNSIKSLSGYFDSLQIASDIASVKLSEATSKKKLFCTQSTLILNGWVPIEYTEKLTKALADEPVWYELYEPKETDKVPVNLINTKPSSYFEPVVSMYSPPAYGTFDPTGIMAFFFFIIFGIMINDALYGVALCLLSLVIVKKVNASPGVKRLCSMFGICGLSCIIFGVIFGSYLGDLPSRFSENVLGRTVNIFTPIDIVNQPMIFLFISLGIGAIHILTGMAIKFYTLVRSRQYFSAFFDVGSLFVIFAGAALCIVNTGAGIIIAAIGATVLVLTGGRHEKRIIMKIVKGLGGLYGLINYASDLLSYSRIMAIGLSSAVVASVFNILATMGGSTVPGIITLIIVLPFGHILNMSIGLLGAFVHTSRLQYIEFFGKFYTDGGRPFTPLSPEIKNSRVTIEKSQKVNKKYSEVS